MEAFEHPITVPELVCLGKAIGKPQSASLQASAGHVLHLAAIPMARESSAFGGGVTSRVGNVIKQADRIAKSLQKLLDYVIGTPVSSSLAVEESSLKVVSAVQTRDAAHTKGLMSFQNASEPPQTPSGNIKMVSFIGRLLKFIVLVWYAFELCNSLRKLLEEAFQT